MTILHKLSLRVWRFFVPVLGWHKPYMTDKYTSDVSPARRRFLGAFIAPTIFGATHDIVTILTDVNNIPYHSLQRHWRRLHPVDIGSSHGGY
jgi:hypothetical protein